LFSVTERRRRERTERDHERENFLAAKPRGSFKTV
jgi:hypothetical protein